MHRADTTNGPKTIQHRHFVSSRKEAERYMAVLGERKWRST